MSAHDADGNRVAEEHEAPGPTGATEQRAAEGVEHLQAAALEMISAARAFLDVIEDLVGDREKLGSVVEAAGSVAEGIGRATRSTGGGDPAGPSAGEAHEGPVEHIRVS